MLHPVHTSQSAGERQKPPWDQPLCKTHHSIQAWIWLVVPFAAREVEFLYCPTPLSDSLGQYYVNPHLTAPNRLWPTKLNHFPTLLLYSILPPPERSKLATRDTVPPTTPISVSRELHMKCSAGSSPMDTRLTLVHLDCAVTDYLQLTWIILGIQAI